MLIRTVLIVFGICVLLLLGVVLIWQDPPETNDVTPQPPIPDAVYDGCPVGFDRYDDEHIEICYPVDLTDIHTQEASSSGELYVTFSNSQDVLTVSSQPIPYPAHLCNVEKAISLQDYSATRTTFNRETAAGCGKPYRFMTLLETGLGVVRIDLQRTSQSFSTSDTIHQLEQSLIVKSK